MFFSPTPYFICKDIFESVYVLFIRPNLIKDTKTLYSKSKLCIKDNFPSPILSGARFFVLFSSVHTD